MKREESLMGMDKFLYFSQLVFASLYFTTCNLNYPGCVSENFFNFASESCWKLRWILCNLPNSPGVRCSFMAVRVRKLPLCKHARNERKASSFFKAERLSPPTVLFSTHKTFTSMRKGCHWHWAIFVRFHVIFHSLRFMATGGEENGRDTLTSKLLCWIREIFVDVQC